MLACCSVRGVRIRASLAHEDGEEKGALHVGTACRTASRDMYKARAANTTRAAFPSTTVVTRHSLRVGGSATGFEHESESTSAAADCRRDDITSPESSDSRPHSKVALDGCARERLIDAAKLVLNDPMLSPYMATGFRPSAFAFFIVERVVLVGLVTLAAVLGRPPTAAASVLQAAPSCALVLAAAWLYSTRQPYASNERWKMVVRVLSFLIMTLATVTNVIGLAAATPSRENALAAAAALPLAWATLSVSMCLMVLLIVGFFSSVVQGAVNEKRATVREAATRLAASAASAAVGMLSMNMNPMRGDGDAGRGDSSLQASTRSIAAVPTASRSSRVVVDDSALERSSTTALHGLDVFRAARRSLAADDVEQRLGTRKQSTARRSVRVQRQSSNAVS